MTASKLPRRLALVGVGVALGFMAMWWYADRIFRLPTEEQVQGMESYTAPLLFWLFRDATFVLCPGSVVTLIAVDLHEGAQFVNWLVAVLLNGVIYYCLGLVVAAVVRARRSRPPRMPRAR